MLVCLQGDPRHGKNKLFQMFVKVSRIHPRLVDLSMKRLLAVIQFVITVHFQVSKKMNYTHYIQSNLITSILGKTTATKCELFQKYMKYDII